MKLLSRRQDHRHTNLSKLSPDRKCSFPLPPPSVRFPQFCESNFYSSTFAHILCAISLNPKRHKGAGRRLNSKSFVIMEKCNQPRGPKQPRSLLGRKKGAHALDGFESNWVNEINYSKGLEVPRAGLRGDRVKQSGLLIR